LSGGRTGDRPVAGKLPLSERNFDVVPLEFVAGRLAALPIA